MPFPLLAAALPYVGYGLMGIGSLVSAGISIYNQSQQRQMYQREEDFNKRQMSDYDRWIADYERNTGRKIAYPYLGMSGQRQYMRDVRLPAYSNLYNMNTANMWSSGAHGAIGLGMSGAFGYGHYRRNNGYSASESVSSPLRDPSRIGPM